MSKKYRALVGLNYNDKRVEAGDDCSDLSKEDAADLLAIKAIEEVAEAAPAAKPKKSNPPATDAPVMTEE